MVPYGSRENAADRPTRLDTKAEDLKLGSEWQEGLPYLRRPFKEWPWERNFEKMKMTEVVPKDELNPKFRSINVVKLESENILVKRFDHGFDTNDYDKLISQTEPYFRWMAKTKAKTNSEKLTLTSRDLVVRFWYRVAMSATKEAQIAGRLKELTLENHEEMIVIRGRASSGMLSLLGATYLPVLMPSERIAELIMLKNHEECVHKSVDVTLFTSRHYCWIASGRKLPKTVVKFCVRCRYKRLKLEMQKMSPLPPELCVPCPSFTNVGLDLAGPFKVTSMLKRKGTRAGSGSMKVWAVLFLCLNTRAIKIYIAPGYATEDFLLAWTEFVGDCGVPRRVHSDRGTQLISAAGEVEEASYN